MKTQEKKRIMLEVLSQQGSPISLSELREKLSYDCNDRSLRRWLYELSKEGLVEKTGTTRSSKYRIVYRDIENKKTRTGGFGPKSLEIIEQIRRPLHERLPIAYNMKWFDSYKPNTTFYLSKQLRDQLHAAGIHTNNDDPAGTYAHKIFNRLLIDLSYNSSRLEGNTYSLLDTERLVISGTGAEGKLDEEKVMILNHKEAIRYLVENAARLKVDHHTICTIHYLLADGLVDSKYAGKVRDHWVRITGSTYLPFEDPRQLQLQLERVAQKANAIQDPFEQSLFLLIHISYLQPFSDVNKRTARLSSNIPLIINNLVPLSFNDVERENYMSAMIAIYELQDVQPLIDLFAFSYIRTCAAYDSTIKAMGFDEVRVRYRKERRNIIGTIISQNLVGTSMLNYIHTTMQQEIPKKDQTLFLEDVLEDVEQIDESRIGGLGITSKQLHLWQNTYTQNKKNSKQ